MDSVDVVEHAEIAAKKRLVFFLVDRIRSFQGLGFVVREIPKRRPAGI